MGKRSKQHGLNEPLRHGDHRRPVSRRDFVAQGFRAGTATMFGASALGLMGSKAQALSPDLMNYFSTSSSCDLGVAAGRKVPFICFDLAGGANISGSNVLVGGPSGQRDSLSTAGYNKLGLPPGILPDMVNPNNLLTNDFIDDSLGLLFHSESAMLQGIKEKSTAAAHSMTNGAVIPARSDNDTGNNPHNPTYGIYKAGVRGQILQLIGSNASDSGGNSMAPAMMIDPEIRPTKIDRPEDASGLVDVGDLRLLLDNENDIVSVLESIKRISDFKLNLVNTGLASIPGSGEDKRLKDRISCEYLKSADTFQKFPRTDSVDPSSDALIVGDSGIFSQAEFDGDREFRKTASVMKLVVDGLAGAGTITMGGYDYHTGDRRTGEARDLRVGRCIGACLEYAKLKNSPLMIYVFSDGSVFSNGMIETIGGIDKGVWTGDNSSTAASFFLVHDPAGRPELLDEGPTDPLQHQQIGWMRSDASVETSATPAANNVNSLVETVILNYMALHGDEQMFDTINYFPNQGLGDVETRKRYTAFKKLSSINASGTIGS